MLHQKYWGRGYATELVKALIKWGFEHISIDKLVAVTHPLNISSQKVLEKSGMDYAGKKPYMDSEVSYFEIYKDDLIELAKSNPAWPKMAKNEIEALYKLLPSDKIIDIQHVGSTAIPGLSAKPVIDIQIAVKSLEDAKNTFVKKLAELNYQYWAENPDPERLFFVKGMPPFGKKRTHHIHVAEASSKRLQDRITFRDFLVLHPEISLQYETLKQKLAKLHTYDREQYTEEKAEFIKRVLENAKL
jgi:GrpB-like predicted nucleotidyltransferase (UPF0157 family)